jgi:hypothetical protein
MFLPLAIGATVASLGVIAHHIIYPGVMTGGFVFEGNYDIVVGYVLLGAVLYSGKWQLPLLTLAVIALILTGSPEAIFAMSVVGVVVLIRKDWGRRLLPIVGAVVAIITVLLVTNWGQGLYAYATRIVTQESVTQPIDSSGYRQAIGYRMDVIRDEMTHITPLGTGYSVTDFSDREVDGRLVRIVHNVPLVMVQQLGYPGVLAALAWLWVSIYCLVKMRWKYAWVALLSLCIWDHFIWTQLNSVWWVLIGVSTSPVNIKSDLFFRRKDDNVHSGS